MQPNTNTGGTPDPAKPEVHPAAELFPLIEGAEFQELVDDIRANGLRGPILLDAEGRVLDGRNRLRACREAGVEPRFETWDGRGSPFEVVVSLNLRRRHLNESQRAMLAAQIKERMEKEASANWPNVEATEKAALLTNISPRSVRRAARILRSGDQELILRVQSGELAVSAAAEQTAGRKAKARRTHRSVPEPAADEMVLALWAAPNRVDEAMKIIGQWGFEPRGKPDPKLPLIATRRNPLAPSVEGDEIIK